VGNGEAAHENFPFVEDPAKLLLLGREMIVVTSASVGLEYPVGEAKALALPFFTSCSFILHLTSHCKVFLTCLGLHIGRVDQVNTWTTLMIGDLYIIPKCMQYRLLMILLGPISMLLDASS
jgi:hypothetical protein